MTHRAFNQLAVTRNPGCWSHARRPHEPFIEMTDETASGAARTLEATVPLVAHLVDVLRVQSHSLGVTSAFNPHLIPAVSSSCETLPKELGKIQLVVRQSIALRWSGSASDQVPGACRSLLPVVIDATQSPSLPRIDHATKYLLPSMAYNPVALHDFCRSSQRSWCHFRLSCFKLLKGRSRWHHLHQAPFLSGDLSHRCPL